MTFAREGRKSEGNVFLRFSIDCGREDVKKEKRRRKIHHLHIRTPRQQLAPKKQHMKHFCILEDKLCLYFQDFSNGSASVRIRRKFWMNSSNKSPETRNTKMGQKHFHPFQPGDPR